MQSLQFVDSTIAYDAAIDLDPNTESQDVSDSIAVLLKRNAAGDPT